MEAKQEGGKQENERGRILSERRQWETFRALMILRAAAAVSF